MAAKPNTKLGKKFVKNARNVLTLSSGSFWPVLEENKFFSLLFHESMRKVKTVHPKHKWSEVRELSKNERKSRTDDFFQNLPPESKESHQNAMELRKDLSLGVNDVCRTLEKDTLACCLISGDAKPKLLVSHLTVLARSKRTPILVYNSLKAEMVECVGFSSLAVGFKKEILNNPSHEMFKLCKEIVNLFNEKYSYDLEMLEEIENCKTSIVKNTFELDKLQKFLEGTEIKNLPENVSALSLDDIYLYRDSTTYRVFRPNDSNSSDRLIQTTLPDVEMEVTFSAGEESGIVNKKVRYYEPPTVLRVQMNPNKKRKLKKKKMEP